jgi:hypothetical protein
MSLPRISELVKTAALEMFGWSRMEGAAVLGESGQLVSGLCAQPKTQIGRNARDRKGPWRRVPIDQLQEWSHSSAVGLRRGTLLENKSSQSEEWNAAKRDLVQGVLQRAAKVSCETSHRHNESAGDRAWGHMLVYGVCEQQVETDLAMYGRTPLASATNLRGPRHLVSGLCPQSTARIAPVAGNCGKQGWNMLVSGIRKRTHESLLGLWSWTSVEGNAEQSEARFMVPGVRQYPQEKQMDARRSGQNDRAH